MNGWVNDWIMGIVEETVNNYIEDEYLANTTEKECEHIAIEIYDLLIEDSDLETEIINLIRQEVDTIYFEDVKPELEGGWEYDGKD